MYELLPVQGILQSDSGINVVPEETTLEGSPQSGTAFSECSASNRPMILTAFLRIFHAARRIAEIGTLCEAGFCGIVIRENQFIWENPLVTVVPELTVSTGPVLYSW